MPSGDFRGKGSQVLNIVDHIFENCDPSATALVHGEKELSFGELRELLDQSVSAIEGTGVMQAAEDGNVRVGLSCPNGFAHVVFSLAVLRSGGCLVPVPSELTNHERDKLVESTGIDLVLTADGQDWHREVPGTEKIEAGGLEGKLLHGIRDSSKPLAFDEAKLAELNPALIRFSSGTTGHSKGVVLSHQTLYDRVTTCNQRLGIGSDDRVIWILPMAHHFAVSIVLYLLHGATTVILDSHLAEDVDGGIRRHEGTVLYASPFHHTLLAEYPGARPFETLRLAVSTAAALPVETAERFRERYELPLTQGLGIIEIGLPLLNNERAEVDPMAVGLPQPGFELKIGNPDENGVGEVLLRGPGMFDAYLEPWQPRDEVTDEEGWFHTGDLGKVDESGSVTLVGRLKSVINVAGMKVFAEEVEAVLNGHPEISESRVSGASHPAVGHVPVAELVAIDPAAPPKKPAILSFCRERLSNYKVPMKLSWVESLPRTASGKIKRSED